MTREHEVVLILDFGGQYTRLIARRVRELGVLAELVRFDAKIEIEPGRKLKGIILSGGPESVYQKDAPQPLPGSSITAFPFLGICYGMQWMMQALGGTVEEAGQREYGPAVIPPSSTRRRPSSRGSTRSSRSGPATPIACSRHPTAS